MQGYMSCCRHCVWSMKFPMGHPIQVTAGPLLNETSELADIPYLNCNNFQIYFGELDTNNDQFLTRKEFEKFLLQSPQRQMIEMHMLDPESMWWTVDLNKDQHVSFQEYVVMRHYWTPIILSDSAPAQRNGEPNANGALGGFYYDNSTISVWVTTANNLMSRLYIANSWDSAGVREPRKSEEKEHRRLRDLDGSSRISFDEHYFSEFADLDNDGYLSLAEFTLSLYNPLAATGAPARTSKSTFAYHDLNLDQKISYMERKRVVADRNENGELDQSEWVWADFPIEYGPFNGHISDTGVLTLQEFKYYMAYHDCTIRGSLAYSRPISDYPWYRNCPINIVVFPDTPFVEAPLKVIELPGIDSRHQGFAMRVLGNVTDRLLWVPKIVVSNAGDKSTTTDYAQGPPDLTTDTFKMALLTNFQKAPEEWACSESLFPNDGFVVVTKSQGPPACFCWITICTCLFCCVRIGVL